MDAPRPDAGDVFAVAPTYVRQGMEQGALGLSSGLVYTPGYHATTEVRAGVPIARGGALLER